MNRRKSSDILVIISPDGADDRTKSLTLFNQSPIPNRDELHMRFLQVMVGISSSFGFC